MDRPPMGHEVYKWPEFKALCERLGVAYGLPTTYLEIRLPAVDEPVVIVHEYRGKNQPPLAEEIQDDKVETTSMHNKEWRTFKAPEIVKACGG